MKCSYHTEREAVAACSGCGTFLCGKCAVSDGEGNTLCSRCIALSSAQEALRGVDRRIEQKEARKRSLEQRKESKQRIWFLAQWGIILLGIVILGLQAPGALSGFEEERPIRKGTYATDGPADRCIANLWRIAKLLQEGRKPGPEIVCPESRRPYGITMEGEDPTARCPNPERHRVKEIRVSMKRPVPEVIP